MNSKALILLAVICPMIWGANMLAKKYARTESHENPDCTNSVCRTSEEDVEEIAPAAPARTIVGVVVAATIVDVRSQTNGVIDGISKSDGDSIETSQILATLDNADLLLEAQSQQAKIAAVGHRIAAAQVDLKMLQEQEMHMAEAQKTNAASAFEVSQLHRQVEAAAARLKGLEEDLKEQQVAARSIDQRMGKYRCLSPISGRVIEIAAVKGAYVQEGQLVARVQSSQRYVNVNLPGDLVEQVSSIKLSTQHHSATIALTPLDVAPNCNLDGCRVARLSIAAGCDLVVGQTLQIQVSK